MYINIYKFHKLKVLKETIYNIRTSGETQSLLFLYAHPYFPFFVMKMY